MHHIDLSALDAPFTNVSCAIEFLLFFPNGLASDKVRAALRGLAEEYWPVFARPHAGFLEQRDFDETRHFIELDARDVDFYAQASDHDLYEKYRSVSPDLGRSLFFLSCIQYRNGTVLIAKLDHLAGDGYSYFYLLGALAANCRQAHGAQTFEVPAPRIARTIERGFRFPNITETSERGPIGGDVELEYLDVTQAEAQQICSDASEVAGQRVSVGDVLTAKVLQKLLQRQPQLFDAGICLTVPIDVRRVVDELGPTYFGNGVVLHRQQLSADSVLSLPEHELAAHLRQTAPKLDRDAVLAHIDQVDQIMAQGYRPVTYAPERGCLVTNLLRMSWEAMDCGTGQPELIYLLTVGPNTASLLPNGSDYRLRILYPKVPVTSTPAAVSFS